MMKSKWKYLVVGVLVVAIVGGIFFVQKNKESNNPPKEAETFLNEYYVNYPEVKNMVKYLNISSDEVKVLEETENKLIFGYHEDSSDEIHRKYVEMMENDGYKDELSDGTVVSAYTFNIKGTQLIIRLLSDIDGFKKDNDDEYLKEVTNQNVICELTK